jgi:hypothetical protein
MRRFTWVWKKWQEFGRAIGDLIGRLVLTVFYFTIFIPFGLVMRFFNDPLSLGDSHRARWVERDTLDQTLEDARRLF